MTKKNDNQAEALATTDPKGSALANYDFGDMAGMGMDTQQATDSSIPFLSVLQALSPQVTKPGVKIPGAEAGMLYNTVTKEIIPGDVGVIFVPCEEQHAFVEWKPRSAGGGFVGIFDPLSDEVTKCREKNHGSVVKMKSSQGNDLVETYYVYGLLIDDIEATQTDKYVCIPFVSTKIKQLKDLNYILNTTKLPNGQKPPLFSNIVRVRTAFKPSPKGDSFNLDLTLVRGGNAGPCIDPQGPQRSLMLLGKKLLLAVRGGTAKADIAKQGDAASTGDPAGDEVF